MEKLIVFIIFAVLSVLRTRAENHAKKPPQKKTTPAARRRLDRSFEQPLRKLEQALQEARSALSVQVERPQQTQSLGDKRKDKFAGEGVSLEHPVPAARETVSQAAAPPLQTTVPAPAKPAAVRLQRSFLQDKEEVLRGLVYAEILGPPKALRHFRRQ
jgi:hypothetical protein